jgi:uncharacterized membrane protein
MKLHILFTILLLTFTSLSSAQTLRINHEEAKENTFNNAVYLDSIQFTTFETTISIAAEYGRIDNVTNLHPELVKNGSVNYELTNDSTIRIQYSGAAITIADKKKIADLVITPKREINDYIFDIEEINALNNNDPILVKKDIASTTVYKMPIFPKDTVVFGILLILVALVFYTSSKKEGFWASFYKYVPALLMCYFLPALLNSFGVISDHYSQSYYIASRYLLPAALVLMTLSIDLKAIANLGPKALIMFGTGTVGIIIGGPLAILLIATFSPETVGGMGPDAVWKGLATLAGSWIGGGANQTAMYEIFEYNPSKYGAMVLVDIVVANLWMAILLLGIGKSDRIDRWLKADNSAIERLKERVSSYAASINRNPSLTDLMVLLGIGLGGVAIAHFGADAISNGLKNTFESVRNKESSLSSFGSQFFWLISIATLIGVVLSYTKLRNYEGAGASKIGSVFIYILVATIGMKMDLGAIFENPLLILVGIIWMAIHAGLLILVAKLIRAPYFFLAVGSQANVGGAASAPVVASAFHPSLATVGVLLAVFGYVVGTYGALLCARLMEMASPAL